MLLNAHVEGIELEGGRATGVRLRGGARIRARRAVVSNASMWDTQARANFVGHRTVSCRCRPKCMLEASIAGLRGAFWSAHCLEPHALMSLFAHGQWMTRDLLLLSVTHVLVLEQMSPQALFALIFPTVLCMHV